MDKLEFIHALVFIIQRRYSSIAKPLAMHVNEFAIFPLLVINQSCATVSIFEMAFNLGFSSVAYLIHYYCRELSHIVLVHYWEKMLSVPEIEEVFGQKRVELSRTPIELNNSYWILKVVPWIGGRIISMMHLPSDKHK
ncbi:hypothetical protein CFP56_030803, partial [Quercus suber]